MSKKNRTAPFKCPVEGCTKTGQQSGILQHISAQHRWLDRQSALTAIASGDTVTEPVPGAVAWLPEAPQHSSRWFSGFIAGMAAGAMGMAIALTVLYLAASKSDGLHAVVKLVH